MVDFDVNLIAEELDFGFKAWSNFPESIVGYQAADFAVITQNITDDDVTDIENKEETLVSYKYTKEISNANVI